jgi:hypothetical protein
MEFATSVGTAISGEPVYDRAEYSFRFENQRPSEFQDVGLAGERTSLAIGTLQIEVNATSGVALYVWGYLPWFGWLREALVPPDFQPGIVTAHADGGFTEGVARRLAYVGEWTTVFDEETGYVRVSREPSRIDDQTVLIATRTCLGLVGHELNSVWVRPTFINEPI